MMARKNNAKLTPLVCSLVCWLGGPSWAGEITAGAGMAAAGGGDGCGCR